MTIPWCHSTVATTHRRQITTLLTVIRLKKIYMANMKHKLIICFVFMSEIWMLSKYAREVSDTVSTSTKYIWETYHIYCITSTNRKLHTYIDLLDTVTATSLAPPAPTLTYLVGFWATLHTLFLLIKQHINIDTHLKAITVRPILRRLLLSDSVTCWRLWHRLWICRTWHTVSATTIITSSQILQSTFNIIIYLLPSYAWFPPFRCRFAILVTYIP